jgi:large subunit ribosomal protein L24
MASNPKNKVTHKAGKQRQHIFSGDLHVKKQVLRAHVADDLMEKYNIWTVRVHKGDTVKIMRGGYAGHTAKVTDVDTKHRVIFIEKVTSVKADGKETPRPVHPSNVLVTKLDLTDPYRKRKLEGMSKQG